ncbi:hypothetical protein KDW_55480 [Dictyobacter vulcani]|uniref:Uncharacterized protein n=1 Tax=Dictyobacter vulcani TaxID=2607529 RepID=A0A5J4L1K9_9CHLR|nr:hypothetical protein KDW_55480 [Dictyobacter vulcani]
MFRNGLIILQRSQQPVTSRASIGQGFQSRKSFGSYDEQRLGRIQIMDCFGKVRAIDIRDKAAGEIAIAIVAQSIISHMRAEIGSTNTNVDNIADTLAGKTLPRATANPTCKVRHFLQHSMYLRNDILTIHDDLLVLWGTQGHV